MPKPANLPLIRTTEVKKLQILSRANSLFPEKQGRNYAKYIFHLIDKDLEEQKTLEEKKEDCLKAETLFLQEQLVRIGNNINQIAFGVNVIKRQPSLSAYQITMLDNYMTELRNISIGVSKLAQK